MSRRCPTKWVADTVHSFVLVFILLLSGALCVVCDPRVDDGTFRSFVRLWMLSILQFGPGIDAFLAALFDLRAKPDHVNLGGVPLRMAPSIGARVFATALTPAVCGVYPVRLARRPCSQARGRAVAPK